MQHGCNASAETIRHILWLMSVPGLGPRRLKLIVDRFGSAAAGWNASETALREVIGDKLAASLQTKRRRPPDVAHILQRTHDIGATIITLCDEAYPTRLHAISGAPGLLYVLGDTSVLSTPMVAVVGTRSASQYGRDMARRIARGLTVNGVTVASGMALGIDGEAHGATLDTGGPTVAVLGSGLDEPYPVEHRRLMSRIVSSGAVLSEYPPGTLPEKYNFPRRNRIVSGLSIATVVVEAGAKSGALITARLALEQGREVFAVPGRATDRHAVGVNRLLAQGATITRSPDDVLRSLGVPNPVSGSIRPIAMPTDATQAAVFEHLMHTPMHIDELIRKTRVEGAEVIRALSIMEVKGLVHHMGNMRWMVAR